MRSGFSMEVNEPCPYCRGTGHSGNLHDETCSECDGSRRLVINITPEERERFRNDPKFYAMVGILERLRNESGLTHADMVSALGLACVSLHENRHRSPRPIEPIEIPSSLAEFINRPNPLMAAAAVVYELPQDAVPGQVWPRTKRIVHDGSGVAVTRCHARDPHSPRVCTLPKGHEGEHKDHAFDDVKLERRPFLDTDKEWP